MTLSSLDALVTASSLLQRLVADFTPVALSRSYTVLHLKELCCCQPLPSSKSSSPSPATHPVGPPSRFGPTILGMCESRGRSTLTASTIHVRLRPAGRHDEFLDYESLVGTLAHELAHIVHQNHSAEFYRLRDEIQEEVEESRRAGTVGGKKWGTAAAGGGGGGGGIGPVGSASDAPSPAFSFPGSGNICQPTSSSTSRLPPRHNPSRLIPQQVHPAPFPSSSSSSSSSFSGGGGAHGRPRPLSRREVLAEAAERRLKDKQWCGGEEGDEEISSRAEGKGGAIAEMSWTCRECTFVNSGEESRLSCGACETPCVERIGEQDARDWEERERREAREGEIERVKREEKRRAEEMFGFDIYGGKKSSTSTLKHLT